MDNLRSCGKLEQHVQKDPNYEVVFNCMAERAFKCTKSKYEVLGQFDFAILGIDEDDPESCKFYMEYKSLEEMGDIAPSRMHELAGMSKTCKLLKKEVEPFYYINPQREEKPYNSFKGVFFELATNIKKRCEGDLVELFKSKE